MEPIVKELFEEEKNTAQEESLKVGILLTFSIGILNACTYVTRGQVFASSQSGNLLYLGLDLAQGDFSHITKYLFPPLMFAAGIAIAEHYHDKPNYPQWRKIPFLIEIALIVGATFMPDEWNSLANPIFGLACGLQTITFHKIRQIPVATIVINGSYQNAVVHLTRFLHIKDAQDAFRALFYLVIVLAFFAGIVAGGVLAGYLGHWLSLVSAGLLLLCLGMVFKPKNAQSLSVQKKQG